MQYIIMERSDMEYFNAQSGIYFEEFYKLWKSYEVYVDEFEDFLRNSDTDTLRAILPDN